MQWLAFWVRTDSKAPFSSCIIRRRKAAMKNMASLTFLVSLLMTMMTYSARGFVLQKRCAMDNLGPMEDLDRSGFNGVWYQHRRTFALRTPRGRNRMSTVIQRFNISEHMSGVGYLKSESWGVYSDNDLCIHGRRIYNETDQGSGNFQVTRRTNVVSFFVLDTDYNSTAAVVLTAKRMSRDDYLPRATGIVIYLRDPSLTPAASVLRNVQAVCGHRFSPALSWFTIPNDKPCLIFNN